MLAAVESPKARMLLTTMYGCGLRISEAVGLQVRDIDSQRMVIHIRQGKGRKDRYVPLGTTLLTQLRDYWRTERPRSFLFPGSQADKPWNVAAVREEFRLAKRIARNRNTLHDPHAAPQLCHLIACGGHGGRRDPADSRPCKPRNHGDLYARRSTANNRRRSHISRSARRRLSKAADTQTGHASTCL